MRIFDVDDDDVTEMVNEEMSNVNCDWNIIVLEINLY
jgi:hypothetical protein